MCTKPAALQPLIIVRDYNLQRSKIWIHAHILTVECTIECIFVFRLDLICCHKDVWNMAWIGYLPKVNVPHVCPWAAASIGCVTAVACVGNLVTAMRDAGDQRQQQEQYKTELHLKIRSETREEGNEISKRESKYYLSKKCFFLFDKKFFVSSVVPVNSTNQCKTRADPWGSVLLVTGEDLPALGTRSKYGIR